MKTATILPTPYLPLIAEDDYHMSLAHLIGTDKEYTEFYKKVGADPNKYLIMDNGVIEGNPRPIEEIVKKAEMCWANEIILPDVFMDMEQTLDKGLNALPYVRRNPNLKVMAVPQGKTLEEWLECAQIMLEWDIDCLGIPKVLTRIAGRDGRLQALMALGRRLRGLEIHLLGCWASPLEITMISKAEQNKKIVPIRGVDSAIAYVYAREGLSITQAERPSGAINFAAKDADQNTLVRNIEIWKKSATLDSSNVVSIY